MDMDDPGKVKPLSPEERGLLDSLPGDLGRIAEVAGVEAALRIARAFRGTYLYIPDFTRRLRDEMIRSQYDSGKPVRELALRHRLTERAIRKILKK